MTARLRGLAVLTSAALTAAIFGFDTTSFCRIKASAKGWLSNSAPDYSACEAAPAPAPQATSGTSAAGSEERFHDNGDGTITDRTTGLMWGKKVAFDGNRDKTNLHDGDNIYPWSGVCSKTRISETKPKDCQSPGDCPTGENCIIQDGQGGILTVFGWITEINSPPCFAGHCDWRMPTVAELQALADAAQTPPRPYHAFHADGCGSTCTDITKPECSCTGNNYYWSGEPSDDPQFAKEVYPNGFPYVEDKPYPHFVRPVRAAR